MHLQHLLLFFLPPVQPTNQPTKTSRSSTERRHKTLSSPRARARERERERNGICIENEHHGCSFLSARARGITMWTKLVVAVVVVAFVVMTVMTVPRMFQALWYFLFFVSMRFTAGGPNPIGVHIGEASKIVCVGDRQRGEGDGRMLVTSDYLLFCAVEPRRLA